MLMILLGGLTLTNSVTNANFYAMTEVTYIFNHYPERRPSASGFSRATAAFPQTASPTRSAIGEETLDVGETRWFSFEAAHAFPLQLAYTGWSMATVVGSEH